MTNQNMRGKGKYLALILLGKEKENSKKKMQPINMMGNGKITKGMVRGKPYIFIRTPLKNTQGSSEMIKSAAKGSTYSGILPKVG